jgi:autotransporter-associated beta strand protein
MALFKSGIGTWTISGVSTMNGPTTVSNGTLVVNGSLTSVANAVTIAGGTLAGQGAIAGPVLVQLSGRLAPGTSAGTLTINNNLTLQGTTIMEIARNSAALSNDLVTGLKTNTYGGTLIVTNVGSSPLQAGDTFRLFAAATYAGAFSSIVYPAGYTFANTLGTDGQIRVVSAPGSAVPNFTPGGLHRLPQGGISLTATGAVGVSYRLWATTNLALTPITSTWTLWSNGIVTTSPFTIIDTPATNTLRRFYLFSTP